MSFQITHSTVSPAESLVRVTMLELVEDLQGLGLPRDRVIEEARELIRSGRVVLTVNFAHCLVN